MSLALALLVTVITSEPARKAAEKAVEGAATAAASAVGRQAVDGIKARRQLGDALVAALATAAVKARTSDNPGSEEWWARHGKKVFDPFADHALATTLARCAIVDGHRADSSVEIEKHLKIAITTPRRRSRWNPRKRPLYASLETFGAENGISTDYFCKILPACIIDAIISAGSLPQGEALATQALLAQLTRVTPQLSGLAVAPLSPLQALDEVQRWCARESDRQIATLKLLPYLADRPDPADLDIGTIVRVGRPKKVSSTEDPYLPLGARVSAHERDIASYEEIVKDHRHVIVLGNPGAGKSWALQMHAIRLANAAAEKLRQPGIGADALNDAELPIAVRCDALAAGGGGLAEAAVTVLAELDGKMTLGLRHWLEDRCNSGRVTFLLDALDETRAEIRDVVYEMVDKYFNLQARLIITCRFAGYSKAILASHKPCEVQVVPFDGPAQYIESLDLPRDRADALTELLRGPALAGMVRIPLLLALICNLASDTSEPLPQTRALIYKRILRRFLLREQATNVNSAAVDLPADRDVRADTLLAILRPLAYRIATNENGWLDSIPTETLQQYLGTIRLPRDMTPEEASGALAVAAGILVRDGDVRDGRDPPYRFVHRTFVEYLVADHLKINSELVDDCLDAHLHLEPTWHQVWILLASMSPESVLSQLVQRRPDPLHSAMSIAAAVVFELDPDTRDQDEVSECVDALFRSCTSLLGPNTDQAVRVTAIYAVARVGGSAAIDALQPLLSEDNDVGEAATLALSESRDPAGRAALRDLLTDPGAGSPRHGRDATFQDFLADAQRDVLRHRTALILSCGGGASIEMLCKIIEEADGELGLRLMLMRVLDSGEDTDVAVMGALRAVVLNIADDIGARRSAAQTLARCGLRGIEPLCHAARGELDSAASVRLTALEALEFIGGPAARDILYQLRDDPDPEISEAAARLVMDGSAEPADATGDAWSPSIEAVEEESPAVPVVADVDQTIHATAMGGPGRDTVPRADETLSQARENILNNLTDVDSIDLWQIARLMLNSEDKAGILVLCELLTRDDSTIRTYAARELGRLGRQREPVAAEALKRALDDPIAPRSFLDEAVIALSNVLSGDEFRTWLGDRVNRGLIAHLAGPVYEYYRNQTCPQKSRPQLLAALTTVTELADHGGGARPVQFK